MDYKSLFESHRNLLIILLSTVLFSSTAIGVQRTILSLYSKSLDRTFEAFVILSAAIALSVYGFAKASGSYLGGVFSDKIGRLNTGRAGIIVLFIGSIVVSLAQNLLVFLVANLIIGLGIGLFFATANINITDIIPQKNRAKALSLLQLSVYFGTSVGSIYAGISADIDLRLAFIVSIFIVFVALILSIFLQETKNFAEDTETSEVKIREQRIFDLKDWWLEELDKYPILSNNEIGKVFDDLRESHMNLPISDDFKLSELKHPSTLVTFSTAIVSRISDATIVLVFPLLALSKGFSTFELGILTSSFTLFWGLGMLITGPLSDRIGRKTPMIVGLSIEFMGILLLLSPLINIFLIFNLFSLSLAGFGRGIYYPISSSIIADFVTPSHRGQALGIFRFLLDFGYVIGGIILVLIIEPIALTKEVVPLGIFETAFLAVLLFLFIQILLNIIFLRDPSPRYSQLPAVIEHLNTVNEGVHHVVLTIFEYFTGDLDRAQEELKLAKKFETKADILLEKMIENTYGKALQATDALEILQFSAQMDKSLSYHIRSLRKLLLIEQEVPKDIAKVLSKYVLLLDILVQETVEVISLLQVQITLASEQSYRVNRVEEVLDLIHQDIWRTLMDYHDDTSLGLILLTQIIEAFEKSANIIEEAAELVRIIAIKHNI